MTKIEKLDKKFNKKLNRLLRAYNRGRICRKIYDRKQNIISVQYYSQLNKLQNENKHDDL